MTLLQVSGLGVAAADGTPFVRDVALSIDAGERLGLIGESGSGKSVTAFSIVGLLPGGLRSSGSILLDGKEVVGAKEKTLIRLRGKSAAVIFQEPLTALDPLMPLGRQLAEPIARHQGLSGAALRQAVLAALAEVRLRELERIAASRAYEISGGQRQRVAIAMALACQPKLLIADEPTTALDVTVQAEVLDLLDRLVADRGMAMLFVSHDLAVVARMTDRVLVLRSGEGVETGPLQKLLRAPEHPYTAELVHSARAIDAALGSVVGDSTGATE